MVKHPKDWILGGKRYRRFLRFFLPGHVIQARSSACKPSSFRGISIAHHSGLFPSNWKLAKTNSGLWQVVTPAPQPDAFSVKVRVIIFGGNLNNTFPTLVALG